MSKGEIEMIIDKDWILVKKTDEGISGGCWTSEELTQAIISARDKKRGEC